MALTLHVNGEKFSIAARDSRLSLLEWLRNKAGVKGPKLVCGEGGCGACAVAVVSERQGENGKRSVRTINSCLVPLVSLHGSEVFTAEGLTRHVPGARVVADRFSEFHASQCGFCTPGMVVTCFGALQESTAEGCGPTQAQLRNKLDGNLCRCTGYRPIVDVCKSFAVDVDMEELGLHQDRAGATTKWEELQKLLELPEKEAMQASSPLGDPEQDLSTGGTSWYSPLSLKDLFTILEAEQHKEPGPARVRLIAGSTGNGIYKEWHDEPVWVYLGQVRELSEWKVNENEGVIQLGASITLNQLADILQEQGGPGMDAMVQHVLRIANHHVRNLATLGGHLMLSREKGLPSDLVTMLLAAGARVHLLGSNTSEELGVEYFTSPGGGQASSQLLPEVSRTSIISSISLPLVRQQQGERFWSGRVAARYVNAKPIINMAIWLRTGPQRDARDTEGNDIIEDVRIALGVTTGTATSPSWSCFLCTYTAAALKGNVWSWQGLLECMRSLKEDLRDHDDIMGRADLDPKEPPRYMRSVIEGLLFEGLCELWGQSQGGPTHTHDNGPDRDALPQPVSLPPSDLPRRLPAPAVIRGHQTYPSPVSNLAPLTSPERKAGSQLQADGTARYSDDVPSMAGCLYAALVPSPKAVGSLQNVDPAAALQLPGVVAFYSAEDIPQGGSAVVDYSSGVPLFVRDQVHYHGQPVGVVVAESSSLAKRAAQLVKVEVEGGEDGPVTSLAKGRALKRWADLTKIFRFNPVGPSADGKSIMKASGDVESAFNSAPFVVRGSSYSTPSQHHFYLEPQTAVASPEEQGGVMVHSSSQAIDAVHVAISQVLALPHNRVQVRCRRLGGAFGGKILGAQLVGTAAALAAVKLQRQVRLVLDRRMDFANVGGRPTCEVEYDVAYDQEGRVLALDMKVYVLAGAFPGASTVDVMSLMMYLDNAYKVPNFRVEYIMVQGDIHPRNMVRAPGEITAVMIMENLMEHLAHLTGLPGEEVRQRNFYQWEEQQQPGDIKGDHTGATRRIVKTSLGDVISPGMFSLPRIWQELQQEARYEARRRDVEDFNSSHTWRKRGIALVPCRFSATHMPRAAMVHIYSDGSVMVSQSGADMGQGLVTKVLQTACHELSKLMPSHKRPLSMDLFRCADCSTELLPHNNLAAASTGSMSACEAVRRACETLAQDLRPVVDKMGDKEFTWQELIAKARGFSVFSPLVPLTAVGWGGLEGGEGEPSGPHPLGYASMFKYHTFGAGISEVEVDVLTGEWRFLRADVMFDCGQTLNPAIDIGQVEGAFVMGCGFMTNEEVHHDPDSGALLNNSTWNYKIPGVMCVPQEFNIHLLKDSKLNVKGPIGSKGVGEPPLLLSPSVLLALQMATRAARGTLVEEYRPLLAPATVEKIKMACDCDVLKEVEKRAA